MEEVKGGMEWRRAKEIESINRRVMSEEST
jgi:hypothetical protein